MNAPQLANRSIREAEIAIAPERARAAWRLDYAINGKFLSQSMTGVQRYAREIVQALDDLLVERNGRGQVLAPRLTTAPAYKALEVSTSSIARGGAWEQCELPLRAKNPVLSLCNVGPLAVSEQILCLHDANVFRCPESYGWKFRRFYQLLQPLLSRRVAHVTSVSTASREDIAELFGIDRREIPVLPNGHEHVLTWNPDRSTLAPALDALRPFVLLIGSVARHKNVQLVLGLANALDELGIDIAVAGGGAAIFAQASLGQAKNVRWLGRVSDDDLACLYRRALCLAFPSRVEGFGLPLLEAMALGCPVVASPIPSSLEVGGDSVLFAGLDEPESWVRNFAQLAASAELRTELAAKGRDRARSFSWRGSAEGYLDLMQRGLA